MFKLFHKEMGGCKFWLWTTNQQHIWLDSSAVWRLKSVDWIEPGALRLGKNENPQPHGPSWNGLVMTGLHSYRCSDTFCFFPLCALVDTEYQSDTSIKKKKFCKESVLQEWRVDRYPCWRVRVDMWLQTIRIFWSHPTIEMLWDMVCDVMQEVLGHEITRNFTVL